MYSCNSELCLKSSSLWIPTLPSVILDIDRVSSPEVSSAGVSRCLAQKGYNPNEFKIINSIESKKIKQAYLQANLETTVNHVFEDSVVSFTNHYQINSSGEIVLYPDGIVLHIDPDERGGLIEVGIRSAITSSLNNLNRVILLYSPPGPVVFDNNPENKFRDVKSYTDGQLYVMYADKEKVNNVAISISSEGESWLSTIMPCEFHEATLQNSPIEKVKYFITHPVLTSKSIDTFLDEQNFQNNIIFNNKDNIEFSLSQTLALIRQSFAGQLPQSSAVSKVLQNIDIEHITAHDIDEIYGTLAQQYMREKGIETLTLGGSCGGTEIIVDIFSNGLNNLSTSFRMITQGENILASKSGKKDQYEDYKCPKCGSLIKGELVDRPETWKTECPHCHGQLRCAKT